MLPSTLLSCFIMKINRMLCCCFVCLCSVLNLAESLHRAPASGKNRSPEYLLQKRPSWDRATTRVMTLPLWSNTEPDTHLVELSQRSAKTNTCSRSCDNIHSDVVSKSVPQVKKSSLDLQHWVALPVKDDRWNTHQR